MKIATVTVDRNGPVVINKSDFREGEDVLWGQRAEPGRKQEGVSGGEDWHSPSESQESLPDDKDALIARLAEHGITKDRRSSLDTLKELVNEL